MKNSNLTKKMTALLKGVFVTALVTSALVACGNKNNNTTQPVNAYTQSCANCQNITGYPFFSAQTQVLSPNYYGGGYYGGGTAAATISWSFSGQNTSSSATGQNYNPYGSPAMNYVGQVSVAGQLNVTTALGGTACPPIPAGTYTITTQQVGQWAGGQISGLRLLISGANVQATATVNNAQAYDSYGYGYSSGANSNLGRVIGSISIESNNGLQCWNQALNLN